MTTISLTLKKGSRTLKVEPPDDDNEIKISLQTGEDDNSFFYLDLLEFVKLKGYIDFISRTLEKEV